MESLNRKISLQNDKSWLQRAMRIETLLAVILVLYCLALIVFTHGQTTVIGLLDYTMVFADKGMMMLGMMLVLLLGQIDISIASTACLSAVLMAITAKAGCSFVLSLGVSVLTGLVCGLINGLLMAHFSELAPMIVTLGTQTVYRGIAYLILGDHACSGFPRWFTKLGWNYAIKSIHLPINFVIFLCFAVAFHFLVHHSVLGKQMYAYGLNPTAVPYNGINEKRLKTIVYTINGLMSALGGIFLAARLGSTRPNMAEGYEMDVIAMCVFGGISTAGGKGTVVGGVISMLLIGYIRYWLNYINVSGNLIPMIIGAMLILVLAVPNILQDARNAMKIRRQLKES